MIRGTSRRVVLGALLAFAASCTVALPSADAWAQQPSPRRVGVLQTGSWSNAMIEAFRQGLRDAGYAEGRDVLIEWRNARGDYNEMPRLITELVQRKIEVLVLDGTPATRAAKRAAPTLSIVMTTVSDPVGSGLVSSLVHPGGNITGLTIMTPELTAKRLQLLKETIPGVPRLGYSGIQTCPFTRR